MKFKDSDGLVTEVSVPSAASSRAEPVTENNKLTDDASTEGIIGTINELDAKILEFKSRLKTLKSRLSSLKSAAAALNSCNCKWIIHGDCSISKECNVDKLVAHYGSVHVNAIEAEIACIETNLEVLECTRALYAFMKPNNMKFY